MSAEENEQRPSGGSLDDQLQREVDAALGDMNLDDLLAADSGRAAPGDEEQVRTGTVLARHGEDIFVDLGGRSEGVLPASQFGEEEGLPEEGQSVEVVVRGYDEENGLLALARKGAPEEANWDTLEKGQVVEGRVTGTNTGGLELKINGIRAFMPISQIELYHVEEVGDYVNEKLRCEVVEANRSERNLIVSRRALLEAEAAEQREKLWETLEEGQVVRGVVRNVMPYGAFVDIGGADGLLHISDMSWSRVEKPEDIVQEGQEIDVKILKLDREERKIGLGLKQTKPDPWTGAEHKWPADSIVTGRVTNLADFGAFVELEEGVEGLIPISEISLRHIRHPSDVLEKGETVKVRVLSIEPDRQRITLSLKQMQDDPWVGASVRWAEGTVVEGPVTRTADFGAFVELAPGVEGLIHISELSDAHVRAVSDVVQEGRLVRPRVLSVDEERRRISLSLKQTGAGGESTAAESAFEAPTPKKKRKRPLKGGLD